MEFKVYPLDEAARLARGKVYGNLADLPEAFGEAMLGEEVYERISRTFPQSFGLLALDNGEVRGGVLVFVWPSPRSPGLVAQNDIFAVEREFRGGWLPGKLFLLAEGEAARRGAAEFVWSVPKGGELGRALGRRKALATYESFHRSLQCRIQ